MCPHIGLDLRRRLLRSKVLRRFARIPPGVYDAYVIREGNFAIVYDMHGKVLSRRRCLGQALMDCLEWLIDKKAETEDKLVKIQLGPYKFQITEQPIIVIDLYRKFAPEYYYQTGIAIVGSEPKTTIVTQRDLPTTITVRNQTVAFWYMASNVYLDKLHIVHENCDGTVVDIVNVGTLWVGKIDIIAFNSKIGFRAVHFGAGDHRSIVQGLRVTGAEVNVIILWDFRYVGFITSSTAKKHFAVLGGLNYCDFLHTLREFDGAPPAIVLRGSNYIHTIRRETTYFCEPYIYADTTNNLGQGVGLTCDILASDKDWYNIGKNFGTVMLVQEAV